MDEEKELLGKGPVHRVSQIPLQGTNPLLIFKALLPMLITAFEPHTCHQQL